MVTVRKFLVTNRKSVTVMAFPDRVAEFTRYVSVSVVRSQFVGEAKKKALRSKPMSTSGNKGLLILPMSVLLAKATLKMHREAHKSGYCRVTLLQWIVIWTDAANRVLSLPTVRAKMLDHHW